MSDETVQPAATPEPSPPEGDWQVPADLQGEPMPEPEAPAPPEPEIPPTAVWGNPMQMAAEMVRATPPPAPVPPPFTPPPVPPDSEIAFDLELAQTDLPRALQNFIQAYERKLDGRLAQRDQAAQAQATAVRVQQNFEKGQHLFLEVTSKDPAMRDPRVATVLGQLVREAQVRGIYNPNGSDAFANPTFHRALLATAKDLVAQERGQAVYQGPPVAANVAGARVMSPKQGAGQPAQSTALTSWEREFCYRHGISEQEFAKNKAATEREKLAAEPWRR